MDTSKFSHKFYTLRNYDLYAQQLGDTRSGLTAGSDHPVQMAAAPAGAGRKSG
jgi:hypothetical protein